MRWPACARSIVLDSRLISRELARVMVRSPCCSQKIHHLFSETVRQTYCEAFEQATFTDLFSGSEPDTSRDDLAAGLAPSDTRESALEVALTPGNRAGREQHYQRWSGRGLQSTIRRLEQQA